MKPRSEFAALFVSFPKGADKNKQPLDFIRLEEQMLELTVANNKSKKISDYVDDNLESQVKRKLSIRFSDILVNPSTISSISWADAQQELMMCKVKAEADYVSFTPKTIKHLEEELIQMCHLREYVDRIEHNNNFHIKCLHCRASIHAHSKNEFAFDLLPSDEWLESAPQLDYFCMMAGNECCASYFEPTAHCNDHQNQDYLLGISTMGTAPNSTRHWLPDEHKIVFSNSYILFRKNIALTKTIIEEQISTLPGLKLLCCGNCNAQIGITLKDHPNIYKLHLSVLHVYGGVDDGDNSRHNIVYMHSRFRTIDCFLAWMLLNKCEVQSSMKLLVRSLDKTPQLLVWLLEPYVLLTKGILCESLATSLDSSKKLSPNASAASFPALKILYKLFDSDSSKLDPRANGGDSSVGILELPASTCLKFTELLLSSSFALPPQLRALGQFYVGFLRLKDRVD